MTKEEINKKIFELQSEADIIKFVDERLSELETNSEEKLLDKIILTVFRIIYHRKFTIKQSQKLKNQTAQI